MIKSHTTDDRLYGRSGGGMNLGAAVSGAVYFICILWQSGRKEANGEHRHCSMHNPITMKTHFLFVKDPVGTQHMQNIVGLTLVPK